MTRVFRTPGVAVLALASAIGVAITAPSPNVVRVAPVIRR